MCWRRRKIYMIASTAEDDTKLAVRSFWLLDLLNNALWVIMLACATNISSGGVALVFLANQLPGLLAKLTAPFWFHKVSYRKRMKMARVWRWDWRVFWLVMEDYLMMKCHRMVFKVAMRMISRHLIIMIQRLREHNVV